jgi:hypothetical protein
MNNNGLIFICGLITTFALFSLASYSSEPTTHDEFFDPMDECADVELTEFEAHCCYQTKSIRNQCAGSYDPNQCIIERTPEYDVCDITE